MFEPIHLEVGISFSQITNKKQNVYEANCIFVNTISTSHILSSECRGIQTVNCKVVDQLWIRFLKVVVFMNIIMIM